MEQAKLVIQIIMFAWQLYKKIWGKSAEALVGKSKKQVVHETAKEIIS